MESKRLDDLLGFLQFLMFFCAYYAEAQRLLDDAAAGKPVNKRRLAYAVLQQKDMKAYLSEYLDRCAFGGSFRFMTEPLSFQGFDLRQGRLVRGDKAAVYGQTKEWYEGFPDHFDVFKYEVAVFARSLTGRDFFDTADWLSEEELFPYPELALGLTGDGREASGGVQKAA